MGTASEHWKRSQDLADAARNLVIALNSGGIALLFSVAGWLAAKDISPSWAICSATFFVFGLFFVGLSLFVAKDRELARSKEARVGGDPDSIEIPWFQRSFIWDAAAFVAFVFGAAAALYHLPSVSAAHG
jgi:cation transporter-like permease